MSTEPHRNLGLPYLNRLRWRAILFPTLSVGALLVAEAILERFSPGDGGLRLLAGPAPMIVAIALVGVFSARFTAALIRQSRSAILQCNERAIRLEKRFRTLSENGSDLVFLLSAEGVVRYISPSVSRLLGYTPQEIIGRGLLELIVPEDQAAIQNALSESCSTTERLFSDSCRIAGKGGGWRWVNVSLRNLLADPDVGAIVCNGADITEWKRVNDTLARLTNGIPVGLYRTTASGEFLAANPALTQMLGYSDEEDLFIANAGDLYADPSDRIRWQELLACNGTVHNFEFRALRRDGTRIWVRESGRTVRDEHQGTTYYEGTLEDITERKLAEEALVSK